MRNLCIMALLAVVIAPAAEALELPKETRDNFQVMAINPGFGNRYRSGCFFPVAVEMGAQIEPVSGTITVFGDEGGADAAFYDVRFDLSPGTRYMYFVYPYCQNATDSFKIVIRDTRGRELRREELSMASYDGRSYYVAVLGGQSVSGITKRTATEKAPGLDTAFVDLYFMPSSACGYEPADAIVWPHPDPSDEKLRTEQLEALREWVLGGGRLVLCIGDSWQAAAASPLLRDLIPGKVTGMENTSDFSDLARLGGVSVTSDKAMAVAVLRDPRGEVLARAGDMPLIVRDRVGFGEVTFVAFDPTRNPFAQWDGAEAFWGHVLGLTVASKEEQKAAAQTPNMMSNRGGRYYQRGYYSGGGLEAKLTGALNVFPEIKPISFAFVIGFLVAYVILVGPVDYFVLKRLKHLEWTWITFPAIALAATVVAFAVIASGRAALVYINQLNVSDWSADGRASRCFAASAVISPKNDHYNVTYRAPGSRLWLSSSRPDFFRGGFETLSATSYRVTDNPDFGGMASDVLMPVWLPKTFCAKWNTVPAERPPLEAELLLSGGRITGSVTNVGTIGMKDVVLVHRSGVYRLGALDAGKMVDVARAHKAAYTKTGMAGSLYGSLAGEWYAAGTAVAAGTFGMDPRFYPAEYFGAFMNEGNSASQQSESFDLPSEFSMRSLVDSGQGLLVANASSCAFPVTTKIALPKKRDLTIYRIAVRVAED
jgi:hypothetical protein